MIYEKFQLHRFYRKLADFAAGGLPGGRGVDKASQTRKEREGVSEELKFEFGPLV